MRYIYAEAGLSLTTATERNTSIAAVSLMPCGPRMDTRKESRGRSRAAADAVDLAAGLREPARRVVWGSALDRRRERRPHVVRQPLPRLQRKLGPRAQKVNCHSEKF